MSEDGASDGSDSQWGFGSDDFMVFMRTWSDDRDSGKELTEADYCAQFPAIRELIAREFVLFREKQEIAARNAARVLTEPGRIIRGRYKLVRHCGSGAFGEVWEARDIRLNRTVAIKFQRVDRPFDKGAQASLQRELEMHKQLRDHPSIAKLQEWFDDDGLITLVMEFVDGPTLESLLHGARTSGRVNAQSGRHLEAPLRLPGTNPDQSPPQHLATMLRQLASAVAHMHRCGIIHRDIKPSNIMLRADGSPVLVDLGLARAMELPPTEESRRGPIGAPIYMCPEMLQGLPANEANDLWALGVVLYECLTLINPFKRPTPAATYTAIQQEDVRPPKQLAPGIPNDLNTIVMVSLEKRRQLRYASAGALGEDLALCCENKPIKARPPSEFMRLLRWMRRQPAQAAWYALLVLAIPLASVAAFYVMPRLQEANQRGAQSAMESSVFNGFTAVFAREHARAESDFRDALATDATKPEALAGLVLALRGLNRASEVPLLLSANDGAALRRTPHLAMLLKPFDASAPFATKVALASEYKAQSAVDHFLITHALAALQSNGNAPDADAQRVQLMAQHAHEAQLAAAAPNALYLVTAVWAAGIARNEAWVKDADIAIMRHCSDSPDVLFQTSQAWLACGNPMLALERITLALQLAPSRPNLEMQLAITHRALGMNDRACEVLDALLRAFPERAAAWHLQGLWNEEDGTYATALSSFQRARQLDPNNARYQSSAARMELLAGDTTAARKGFQQAIVADHKNPGHLVNYGVALGKDGQHGDARMIFGKALELDPTHARALREMSVSFLREGQAEQAIPFLEQAVKATAGIDISQRTRAATTARDSRTDLGAALWQTGNSPASVAVFGAVLAAIPEYWQIRMNLGIILTESFDPAGGEAQFDAGIAKHGNEPVLLHQRALARMDQGRWDTAIEDFDAALATRSINPGLKEDVERARQTALDMRAVLASAPTPLGPDPTSHLLLAEALSAAGRHAEAAPLWIALQGSSLLQKRLDNERPLLTAAVNLVRAHDIATEQDRARIAQATFVYLAREVQQLQVAADADPAAIEKQRAGLRFMATLPALQPVWVESFSPPFAAEPIPDAATVLRALEPFRR